MTQIWIVVCLLLAWLRLLSRLGISLQQMPRLLQLNLFERCVERRNLRALLRGDPPEPQPSTFHAALQFL